jgi:AcrR family transcriptional regulator
VSTRTRLPRAEREQQMLATARGLFAQRGYADVTMDEVASAVGVTKPLLYTYFGNKEQLFLAGMQPAAEKLLASVVEAVRGASTPAAALRDGLHAYFAFLDADHVAWRVLYDETLPAGGEIARAVGEYRGGGALRSPSPSSAPPRRSAAGGRTPRRSRPTAPQSS